MADLLQFPFVRGMDEAAEPKGIAPGTPLSLENRYIDKLGRVVKRPGVDALAATILGGGSIAAGVRLITRGDDLAVFDGERLYSYVDALSKWQAVDRPPSLKARRRPLLDVTRSVAYFDMGIYAGQLVLFYQTGTQTNYSLYVEVRDASTGRVLKAPEFVEAGTRPRVVVDADNGITYLLWSNGSNEIKLATLTMSTLSVTVQTALVSTAVNQSVFDAVLATIGGDPHIVLAYELSSGASRLRLATFELSGYAVVNTATFAGTGYNHICLDTDDTLIHCVYGETVSNDTRIVTTDTALGSAVGPTNLDTTGNTGWGCAVAAYDATNVLVAWARDNGSGTDGAYLTTKLVSAAAHAAVANTTRITYGLVMPSRPFAIGSRWYMAATTYRVEYNVTPTIAQPNSSGVLIEIETANSLTGASNGTHPHAATLENHTGFQALNRMSPATGADGEVYVPAAYRNREPLVSKEIVPFGIGVHVLEPATEMGPAAVGIESALVPCAAPFWWDGLTAMPYGFAHAPMVQPPAASAGGSQTAGTYGYLSTYLWRDTNGRAHRSAPSPSVEGVTAGGNLTLSPVVASSSLSSKQRALFGTAAVNPVVIELWRTAQNGSEYLQLIDGISNVFINDPQVDDVTFTDGDADSVIAGRSQVYTASGELDNVPPPASLAALAHVDRFWLLASDGHTVWATKAVSDDPTVAPGFNEALTTYFAKEKTCLGALPNATAVLGPDSIDLITGLGPDATGTGAFGQQGVQTDLGAISSRCLATIPQGLVYRSRRGVELLTTGLTIEWIGEAIQDTLATYPNVTSAIVVSDKRQVRISCNNDAGSAGRVLVLDYGRNAWSVWNYGFAIADAAMIGTTYTLLRANGVVYRENARCRDDGVYVESAATISVTSGGPQSWERLKCAQLLGTSVTDHTLTMRIKRDFADTYEYTKAFSSAEDVTTPGPLEKARIYPPIQKGQGFVVRIEDSAPDDDDTSDSGAGPMLEQLAVWVQRKSGPAKASASRRG